MYNEIPYTRIYAVVDLDAVAYNMKSMKANVPEETGIIGVVKTDGYGHGAVPVAKAMDPYVQGYAVATIEEALNLRHHGIRKMVLVLGPIHERHYEDAIREEIRVPVFTWSQAAGLSEKAAFLGKNVYVHLALDTGMNRIGMKPDEVSADMAVKISELPGICVEGLFTHFAKADETDKTSAKEQMKAYADFLEKLKLRGLQIPMKHIANSAAIMDLPEAAYDLVRAGISVYGLYPSDEVDKAAVPLKPVMGLKCYITYMKEIEPGAEVSYGGTFVADRPMTIATISAGYGDGYPRNLSGKGRVLIHGKSAPILGRVCMDQIMVDVTHIPEAREWDLVTLIGEDGEQQITVEELAETGGGFHYEIICDIGKRVPRVYVQAGKIVGMKDYSEDIYADFLEESEHESGKNCM